MKHITGISSHQMLFSSLEDAIAPDNQVRFIDTFVMYLDFSKFGFTAKTIKSQVRMSYNAKVFLKIYLYGYLNGIRSSRIL